MGQSSTTDTLTLGLSEDAYKGDVQFTVTLDGKPLGAAQTVTASHVDLGFGIEARRVVRAKTLVSFTGQPAHAMRSFPAMKSVRKAVRECV